jgi:hypothetical protein
LTGLTCANGAELGPWAEAKKALKAGRDPSEKMETVPTSRPSLRRFAEDWLRNFAASECESLVTVRGVDPVYVLPYRRIRDLHVVSP